MQFGREHISAAVTLLCAACIAAVLSPAFAGIGPATELGQNPVRSYGGSASSSAAILTATGGDFVITDVVLTTNGGTGGCYNVMQLQAGGAVVAEFFSYSDVNSAGTATDLVAHSFASGLRVPEGTEAELSVSCSTHYTVSGYVARP
jgi:hypothetical protein